MRRLVSASVAVNVFEKVLVSCFRNVGDTLLAHYDFSEYINKISISVTMIFRLGKRILLSCDFVRSPSFYVSEMQGIVYVSIVIIYYGQCIYNNNFITALVVLSQRYSKHFTLIVTTFKSNKMVTGVSEAVIA